MGALIPLALAIAPEISKWLFGSTAAATVQAVTQAVQTVTGTTDLGMAQTVLGRDPAIAGKLRVELAKIAAQAEAAARASDLAAMTAQLSDVRDARAQTVALAQAKSAVQWGAPVVTALVLLMFGTAVTSAMMWPMPTGAATILNMVLGTLAAMATSCVSYWVGSSRGSDRKTDLLYQSTPVQPGAAQ